MVTATKAKKKPAKKKPAAKKGTKKGAKKKSTAVTQKPPRPKRDRQKRLPGTTDPANEKVNAKAQEYVDYLSERMKMQKAEGVTRAELIELLNTHGIELVRLDGHEVKLVHKEASDKIKVKTLKEDED
jgi:hypothetical protein